MMAVLFFWSPLPRHSFLHAGGSIVLFNHNYLAIVYFGWGTWASAMANILTGISQNSSSLLGNCGYCGQLLRRVPLPASRAQGKLKNCECEALM